MSLEILEQSSDRVIAQLKPNYRTPIIGFVMFLVLLLMWISMPVITAYGINISLLVEAGIVLFMGLAAKIAIMRRRLEFDIQSKKMRFVNGTVLYARATDYAFADIEKITRKMSSRFAIYHIIVKLPALKCGASF